MWDHKYRVGLGEYNPLSTSHSKEVLYFQWMRLSAVWASVGKTGCLHDFGSTKKPAGGAYVLFLQVVASPGNFSAGQSELIGLNVFNLIFYILSFPPKARDGQTPHTSSNISAV